ncbi:cytochrome P450 4F3-like [Cavia porcellus]|uniref:cytochrome P450 4F3-like n=1 Tax=Cavia porcellus TaxID=10141 RepID=UPI0006618DA1
MPSMKTLVAFNVSHSPPKGTGFWVTWAWKHYKPGTLGHIWNRSYVRDQSRKPTRNCTGQTFPMAKMKVVLVMTLLSFCALPDDVESIRKPELILRTESGLWLQMEPPSLGV